jgi:hypothetical protein
MPAILFLLFSSTVFSQPVIKGTVIASATGLPVAGSSVFINNTSRGTTADRNGYFELGNIPAGKYELIISSVGYETSAYSFNSEQLPLKLRIELQLKVKELQNVTVEPSVEEGWDKWGKLFTDNFIGQAPNAGHCKIKNEQAIRFRYFKKSNRVIAFSDEPIIIENKTLGYRIKYQLEEFEVNFKTRASFFAGYPLFEDLDNDRKEPRQRWKKNRDKAYYGSLMHFMHSLYNDSLQQQGFEVRRMVKITDAERERVKKIYERTRVITTNGASGVPSGSLRPVSPDSMAYYEQVMSRKDINEIYGKNLLTADSLVIKTDGAYKFIFFTDYLYVTYKNEFEDAEYLTYHGERRSRTYQRSYITLPNLNPILIDVNGNYTPPQEVLSMAYWGWSEKMADCLPIDYKPWD